MKHPFSLRLKITALFASLIILVAVLLTLGSNYNLNRFFVNDMIKKSAFEVGTPEDITSFTTSTNIVSFEETNAATLIRDPWPKTMKSSANQYLWKLKSSPVEKSPAIDVVGAETMQMQVTVSKQKSFVNAGWIFTALLILFGVAAAYVILGRALRPLQRLSKAMKRIDERNLSERIENSASSSEMVQLTGAYNRMLERLDKAFEAQKNFTASAAHELKTPLACMQANLEVLQLDEQPSEEEYKETIDVIRRNTQRLILLVEDLLAINTNSRREKHQWIQIEEMIGDICRELSPQIQRKDIKIQINCQGKVYGDSVFLYRAFYNLIENAVKYNRPGGKIKIISQEGEQQCRISIADTGIGIPEEEIEHIFEPFYRVDKSRSREIGGSGLGLAIVKDIIEKHHGKINVRQKEGTIFEIVLPKE